MGGSNPRGRDGQRSWKRPASRRSLNSCRWRSLAGRKGAWVQITELVNRYQAGERSFEGVSLAGANLRGVDLSDIVLRGADLRFTNLREANLRGADLSEANLYEANLQDADLRQANLSRAVLWLADPLNAHLEGANLKDAKVAGAQLARAASLAGATLPDGTVHA